MESPYSKPRTLNAEAVDGDYFKIRNMEVASGRLLSPQEMAIGAPVIVVGKEIADKFFPNLDPLGKILRLGGIPYTIIGVAKPQGSVFGLSLDRFPTLRTRVARIIGRMTTRVAETESFHSTRLISVATGGWRSRPAVAASHCPAIACVLILTGFSNSMIPLISAINYYKLLLSNGLSTNRRLCA